jgi:hypothetical protein
MDIHKEEAFDSSDLVSKDILHYYRLYAELLKEEIGRLS